MNPLLRIRRDLFRASQAQMAAIAQVHQGTWSKWERGRLEPTLAQLRRVRREAILRRLEWNDRLFFSTEEASVAPASSPVARRPSSQKRASV